MSVQIAYSREAYRCYLTDDGIRRRYVGCMHRVPREAVRHAGRLTEPYPLGSPSEDPDPRASAPVGRGPVGSSDGGRELVTRTAGG